jgi:hypothetical protein
MKIPKHPKPGSKGNHTARPVPRKCVDTIVLNGETASVHNTIFLVEGLLRKVDGNMPIFTATRKAMADYLDQRIQMERAQKDRLWKNERIGMLKALRRFF